MDTNVVQCFTNARMPLPAGTSLHHRYSVRQVLRLDAYTLLYDGFDYVAHQPIAILEFFPASLSFRTEETLAVSPVDRNSGALYFLGMEAFYRQYDKLLQSIGSPNVLSIFDVFYENGTAYAIVERVEGVTLSEYIGMRERGLTDGEFAYIARALSDALLVVHSCGILHHGVTPDCILLCTDGTVKLTDFSAGRSTVETGHAVKDDEPWTDLHALGCTLQFAYRFSPNTEAEHAPSDAIQTLISGLLSDSPSFQVASVFDLRYMVESLNVQPEQPIFSMDHAIAYRDRMLAGKQGETSSGAATDAPKAEDAALEHAPSTHRRMLLFAISAVLLALLIALIVVLSRK